MAKASRQTLQIRPELLKPKASQDSKTPSMFSTENLEEAEQLLPKMNLSGLGKLKQLLESKAISVQKDLEILQNQERKLLDIRGRLQSKRIELEKAKIKASEDLRMMRDNICNIPGFNCKIFELRGEAILQDTVRDRWIEKAETLDTMENLINDGAKKDKCLSEKANRSEAEWRCLMQEYMNYEEQVVVAISRLEDLRQQSLSYDSLVKQQQAQLQDFSQQSVKLGISKKPHSSANAISLREKVMADIPDAYTVEHAQDMIDSLDEHAEICDETLEKLKDTVNQIQGFEDIRQHSLQLVLEIGSKSGQHGVDREVWSEIVRCGVKSSAAGLTEKIEDYADSIAFRKQALKQQLHENDQLITQLSLANTRSFSELISRSDIH